MKGPSWSGAWHFAEPRLLMAQLALVDRNIPTVLGASALAAWLTAAAFLLGLGENRVTWWALATSGLCMLGWLARRRLPRPDTPDGARRYAQGMRLVTALNGLAWGGLALLFIDPQHPESTNIVVGVIVGVSSAGLAAFGSTWPLALSYWFSCMLPLTVALWRASGVVNVTLGLGALIYLWVMVVYSYHTARATRRAIELRFENEALVASLRDQTQRALAARQLAEQAQQDAEAANRAKTRFLASASHDLRQPLHAAGLFLGSLARSGLNERQAMLLEHAQASTSAASEMLNTLMDFSKVDAGLIHPEPHSFALQPLFHKLERELAPWAAQKGLSMRVHDTTLALFADPGLVELVLRNLLLNAIRYTERGGVLLGCRKRAGRAVIEVWDTGIGIPSEDHQAIFQEFHQLGNPERDRRNGLGLGLAIVDGLARAMSVTVNLASRPGRGSVFRLTLPLSLHVASKPAPAMPAGDLNGLRVLLIDDDESVRLAMADLMGLWGVHCETAGSAEEALARLTTFSPEVVLADYRLRSHTTGLQVVEAIRARLGRPVPAALVTGDTASERRHDADAGGLALLHKPVPAEPLQALLLRLGRPAPEAGLASSPQSGVA